MLNGQKCWQSYAQDMDYLWVLARSGTQESRGRGLSLFICDKQTPGVTVSPLPTVDGDQLNEVFFDDVEVPVDTNVSARRTAPGPSSARRWRTSATSSSPPAACAATWRNWWHG